jgi:uncharacterized heparinase superfamily protein
VSQKLASIRRFWDTVRYLRPIQIYGRLWYRTVRPNADLRSPPALRQRREEVWVKPPCRRPSLLGPSEFQFLNENHQLADVGWDDPEIAKLWRYNLHYFDDLNAVDAARRLSWHQALISQWVAENPPADGSGWEPYPTSLRIVNWIKWALAGNQLTPQALHSLAVQARWLLRRLEYHLLGNHLFANAKALVFAGSFFDGPEADAWLERGMQLLAREVPEQILPDGAQFELSPMYHALALEDLLDLFNVARATAVATRWQQQVEDWCHRVGSMRRWLAALCHPDGEIAFFNDAAIGIAPAPRDLEDYAVRLGFPVFAQAAGSWAWLQDSGYMRLEGPRAVALLDVAPIGPDYLPGHAHADTLSFELSIDRHRLLVNSGTSLYGTCRERQRQRGTAAHNTVVVNGLHSSETWSGFRVARRARPYGLTVSEGESWTVSCAHDGYKRLPGSPSHMREWVWVDDKIVVADRIEGPHREAVAHFHFHPDLQLTMDPSGTGDATRAGERVVRIQVQKGRAEVQPSTWHPEFGMSIPAQKLMVHLAGGESLVEFSWKRT